MASFIYSTGLYDAVRGMIDYDSDTFKVLLASSSYSPSKIMHTRRSDVTGEVVGVGYTAGGEVASVTATNDTINQRIDISLGSGSWVDSTITARYAVYYKSRGGADMDDELVAVIDFGSDVSSTNGTFSLSASTLRLQN